MVVVHYKPISRRIWLPSSCESTFTLLLISDSPRWQALSVGMSQCYTGLEQPAVVAQCLSHLTGSVPGSANPPPPSLSEWKSYLCKCLSVGH